MVLRSSNNTAVLDELVKFLRAELLKTWKAQGHYMNGAVVREADFVLETKLNSLDLSIFMFPYGGYIESGVSASNIPYSGNSGSGGTSKYIQALIGYAMKRMSLPDQKAKQVAFAIATKQKREGMPTAASKRFSSTGKRTMWIEDTMKRNESKIQELLFEYVDIVFTTTFENIILKYTRTT